MINIPGRIPISIHPIFWVLAGLIGWFNSGSLVGMLIWMLIILISILVHELGHATMAIIFKQNPRIDLVALGGVTSYEAKNLKKFSKQFLIVLMGPLFGLSLFFISWGILSLNYFQNIIVIEILSLFKFVNLFWTLINLLPILPLDGGQLLRIALEAWLGLKGFKLSIFIGMSISFLIAMFFFVIGGFLIGAIFFIFAFQGFDMWRKSKHLSTQDRDEDNTKRLNQGEIALQEGRKDEAKKIFLEVRDKTKKGIIFVAATHYLALLDLEEGKTHEAYELLFSVKDHLEKEALCLLQKLAFKENNYGLVAKLSSSCYQFMPTQEVALMNAKAFAHLKKAKPAGGWLRKAVEFGKIDINKLLSEKVFLEIKEDPLFKHFFH